VAKLTKQSEGEKYAPLAGWITMILGDFGQTVEWMQIALDCRISQVMNMRCFAYTLSNSALENTDIQTFLGQLNLDDKSIESLYRAQVSETVKPLWSSR
jgi:ABC-type uncharacterized transport system fused permease/ATPase subunit